MKKSINTRLKHSPKDQINRSANPPVVRASTILFDSMQELAAHEKKIINRKKLLIIIMEGMEAKLLLN
jgi:hypothetical protein